MSLSTLVGTTWYFNEHPDWNSCPYNIETSEARGFQLSFTSNRTSLEYISWDLIDVYYDENEFYGDTGYHKAYDSEWESEPLRYIEITGGDYATNSDFIEWLEDNAVQIPTDLTGTSWLIKDSPDLSTDTDWNGINFTSDGNSSRSYTRLRIRTSALRYYYSSTGYSTAKSSTAWTSEGYKTIHITGGSLATDSSLISWLVNNATQIIDDAKLYIGVNNLSSKLGNKYVGVNNLSRKLVKGYIGVNNLSQKIF